MENTSITAPRSTALPEVPEYDDTWEQIRLEFIEERERGHQPTLDTFVARYPQYAEKLVDFVLDYTRMENAFAREEINAATMVGEQTVSYAIPAWEKAMAALGIPIAPESTVVLPLLEQRKSRKWTTGYLARLLHLTVSQALLLEGGQMTAWSGAKGDKLRATLAAILAVPSDVAEAILRATSSKFRAISAGAFSSEGDPNTAQVNENLTKTYSLDEILAKEKLTPDQQKFWDV